MKDLIIRDYEGFREAMLKRLLEIYPDYDTSPEDVGVVIIELVAHSLDILSYYLDVQGRETYLNTAKQRSSINNWCEPLGYVPRNATPSIHKQVFKLVEPLAYDYTIPKGTLLNTEDNGLEPLVFFRTLQDLVIPSGKLGDEKSDLGTYLYSVEVEEGYPLEDILNKSTGLPYMQIPLNNLDCIVDTLRVFIDEGTGYREYTKVDTFIDSKGDSLHFKVSLDGLGGTILKFGDNATGKIPNKDGKIKATYCTGGGEKGNVNAGSIINITENNAFIESTFNILLVQKGYDLEENESIKRNAPLYSRARWGLIDLLDFESVITRDFPQALQVKALRDNVDKLKANIYVYTLENFEALKNRIIELLTPRLMLGVSIALFPPTFKNAILNLDLEVKKYYDPTEVKEGIKVMLEKYMDNLPFGHTLIFQDLEYFLKNEVEGIKIVKITNDGNEITSLGNEIIKMTSFTIRDI